MQIRVNNLKVTPILFFWLCGLFITNSLQSQNYFDTYISSYQDQGYTHKTTVDSLLVLCKKSNDYIHLSDIATHFSTRIYSSHISEAIHYGKLALDTYPLEKRNNPHYATLQFRLGFFYSEQNDFEKSNALYLAIIEQNTNPARVAQSYSRLGLYYSAQGDYYRAIDYFKKGISLLEKQNNYRDLVKQYINFSVVYHQEGSKESFLKKKEMLDKALALEEKTTILPIDRYHIYTGYATFYTQEVTFDLKSARAYHFKNLKHLAQEGINDYTCDIYGNLSDLYNIAKNDSALYYIEKTLKECPDTFTQSVSKHHLSQYYRYRGNAEKALDNIQRSLTLSTEKENKKRTILTRDELSKIPRKIDVFAAFKEKAGILEDLFEENKNLNDLSVALDNILIADTLIDFIEEESLEKQSLLLWRQAASSLYAQGVRVCKKLNKPETTFYFIEKNKALLLTSEIDTKMKSKKLPDTLQKRQSTFKKEILALENTISETENSEKVKQQQEVLFDLKTRYQKLQDSISIAFPLYKRNTLHHTLLTITDVQNSLNADTAVLSYIWGIPEDGDEVIYGIYIDQTSTELFEVDNIDTLKEHIFQYRNAISKPFETKTAQENYSISAYALYNTLFPTQSIKASIKGKELLIIPDGELQYVPFDAFLTSDNSKEYFIKSNKINYSYSLSFSKRNEAIQRTYDTNFVGFAPITFSNKNLNPLQKSRDEITSIEKILKGKSFLETTATKDNFLTKSSSSEIVHLATHADASSNPWIAFYDTILESHELYTYQNNAELVVLSACNTTIGDIAPGEGVMSLARGFFYAGANTVVSSLWETNDKATSEIMTSFYTYLKEGNSKSDALYKAKLNYISSSNLSQQSPYYWAPFILIGEAENSLYSTNKIIILSILSVSILLFIISLYIRKRKNKILG
ncbi:CHAT domain-containing tetratricopeptide repeat protein [uncultured Dokdonia sp.]|uniref:CHAT domain-containing protein n=1 Tax=uncultured Dokdonia sp. TaxID=575653 RepID=UPI00261194F5|nr:CHAT domain-containing tetratricopeptide repeat protein [uncultured Dokdonia sp.]